MSDSDNPFSPNYRGRVAEEMVAHAKRFTNRVQVPSESARVRLCKSPGSHAHKLSKADKEARGIRSQEKKK